jgi:hypothetical protein
VTCHFVEEIDGRFVSPPKMVVYLLLVAPLAETDWRIQAKPAIRNVRLFGVASVTGPFEYIRAALWLLLIV